MRNFESSMQFGVELEGGFNHEALPCTYERDYENDNREGSCGCVLKYDGSVEIISRCNFVGEINSPILGSFTEVKDFLRTHSPSSANSTCGFHLHLSWKNGTRNNFRLGRLFDRHDVEIEVCRNLEKVAYELREQKQIRKLYLERLLERLRGENQYCRISGYRDNSNRYRAVNFAAYYSHKSLEIRIFPGGSRPDAPAMAALAENAVETVKLLTLPEAHFDNSAKIAVAVKQLPIVEQGTLPLLAKESDNRSNNFVFGSNEIALYLRNQGNCGCNECVEYFRRTGRPSLYPFGT